MNNRPVRGLLEYLQQVPDPRGREGKRHQLSAMLAAVVCATLCEFRGLRQTVRWLKLHGTEMSHLLGFTRHPPVRQTFANLLARIDPEALDRVLVEFVEQLEICQAIVGGGGEYLVTVKGNQPNLLRDAEQAFVIPRGFSPLRRA